jgi:hypothetical protein
VKPITGPADVKIGNRVRFSDPSHEAESCSGVVAKVTDERLTIRTDDGRSKSAAYLKRYSYPGAIGRIHRLGPQWTLITEQDLWQRKCPATPLLDKMHSSARAAAHDLAARTALHTEVDALADWYAVEPEVES